METQIMGLFNNNVKFSDLVDQFSVEKLMSVNDKTFMIHLFAYFLCSGSNTDNDNYGSIAGHGWDDFVLELNRNLLSRLNDTCKKVTFNNYVYLSDNEFTYDLIDDNLISYDCNKSFIVIKNSLNEILFENQIDMFTDLYVMSNKYLCIISSRRLEIYEKDDNTYSSLCYFDVCIENVVSIDHNLWVLTSKYNFIILDASNGKLNVMESGVDHSIFVSISHANITNLRQKILDF